ncbi:ABC exporter membrane fusion protein [Cylindrospermum sp. FACHB-282]|uniref:ABC exporter membrane fusion protein n=1 Tax=Cylindrospermum sp. FACHB-282 TaxID=2692794 RepID=UPI001688A7A5|nr:ABC exporter membrane fusion protein [Cylindrospermum sp. FACHB-282]MBD2385155.1 ABC exporter membrane fusion protein [Cylindrospermum sp. FACHB-282]
MGQKLLFKPANQGLIGLVIAATAVTGAIAVYGISQFGQVSKTASSDIVETKPIAPKVTGLGRLEPETEIISLSAPLALNGDRISQILVQEGDRVEAGQVIAILDSRERLQNAVIQSEKQLRVAQAKLVQVKAGAKTGEIQSQQSSVERLLAQSQGERLAQEEAIARYIAQWQGERLAQEATIRKLQAEFNNAQAEYQRYQQLYSEGAISNSAIDSRRLSVETAKQQLGEAKAVLNRINTTANKQLAEARVTLNRIKATGNKQVSEAKGTLSSIAEVRPVDVAVAQAEVESAIATLKRAQTEYKAAYIKAPIAGHILNINKKAGEKTDQSTSSTETTGIADLAQTDQMMAIAEIYQTDIGKVKLGQNAVITSQAFPGELRGTVTHVGLQVKRQNVFSSEPGENLDQRVIEVKIRLNKEDSKQVSGLTNLQVQTAIEL